MTGSAIVGNDVNYLTHLSTWLKPVAQSKSSRWKHCWRASVDGWASSTFHSLCNNKGPTVTIIRVGGKYIFGGYTSLSWGKWFGFFWLRILACKIVKRSIWSRKCFLPRRGLKKSAFTLFQTFIALIPFRSIRQMEVNFSGFKFEKSLPNLYQNRCLVYTYPIKLKLGRFTSYSCCEFADN